jgi:FMN-dependent NADH-azoreductase
MNILHIDSSILGEHSASHRLSAAVVARLLEAEPDASVVYRDLAIDSVPQLNGALANIANVPLEQQSAELRHDAAKLAAVADEVVAADVIVVGAPMYNFGISSQLKSWVDALAVPGKTFRYSPEGAEGLLGEKRVVIASARGGFYGADTPLAALDHQETYLRNVLSDFFGVKRFEIVRAEGLKISPEMNSRGMKAGLRQAAELRIS